jgi:hypothetical protein
MMYSQPVTFAGRTLQIAIEQDGTIRAGQEIAGLVVGTAVFLNGRRIRNAALIENTGQWRGLYKALVAAGVVELLCPEGQVTNDPLWLCSLRSPTDVSAGRN